MTKQNQPTQDDQKQQVPAKASANYDRLLDLYRGFVQHLSALMKEAKPGELKAAELNVIRQFLSDNKVSVDTMDFFSGYSKAIEALDDLDIPDAPSFISGCAVGIEMLENTEPTEASTFCN